MARQDPQTLIDDLHELLIERANDKQRLRQFEKHNERLRGAVRSLVTEIDRILDEANAEYFTNPKFKADYNKLSEARSLL